MNSSEHSPPRPSRNERLRRNRLSRERYGQAALRILDSTDEQDVGRGPLLLDISVAPSKKMELARQRRFAHVELADALVPFKDDIRTLVEQRIEGRDASFGVEGRESRLRFLDFRVFDSNLESHRMVTTFTEQLAIILDGRIVATEIVTKDLPSDQS